MHLSPNELIDLAEGTRPESATSHLQSCEVCRHRLAELRASMAAAVEVDVPEPSPLFWEQLSARVREAVAAEEGPRAAWWHVGWWKLSAGALAAVAALALAVYLTLPRATAPATSPFDAAESLALQPFGSPDEPSLALVADLTAQMDSDMAAETGLTNHVGSVDEAVSSLTDDERRELQLLLTEALAKPGA